MPYQEGNSAILLGRHPKGCSKMTTWHNKWPNPAYRSKPNASVTRASHCCSAQLIHRCFSSLSPSGVHGSEEIGFKLDWAGEVVQGIAKTRTDPVAEALSTVRRMKREYFPELLLLEQIAFQGLTDIQGAQVFLLHLGFIQKLWRETPRISWRNYFGEEGLAHLRTDPYCKCMSW